MDGMLTDGRIGRLWTCSKGSSHVLGVILHLELEGQFTDQLLLFRATVNINTGDVNGKPVALPDVKTRGFLEGTMHDIECDLCNAKRTWWMGRNGFKRAQLKMYLAE